MAASCRTTIAGAPELLQALRLGDPRLPALCTHRCGDPLVRAEHERHVDLLALAERPVEELRVARRMEVVAVEAGNVRRRPGDLDAGLEARVLAERALVVA